MREEKQEEERGGKLKRRLKGVRKRKQAQRTYKCDMMAYKMRLVKTREKRGR